MTLRDPLDANVETAFRLASLLKVEPPAGSAGDWHSYVISQGTNTITGMRCGSHAEVARLLDEMVERLNQRRMGKKAK